MANNTPESYFERAKALQKMISAAQADLKQLKADAVEELIDEATPKKEAAEIRKDLAEVFYLAGVEAKSDSGKLRKKIERLMRVAEAVGVQLSLI